MKNIVCGIDDHYFQHCGAMLLSLFEHNKDNFTIYILALELGREHKKLLEELVTSYQSRIHFIDIGKELIANFPMKSTDYPSLATYLRLFISRILPLDVDKALYVDSDIIFCGDISELYDSDITNYALAGMEDAPNQHSSRLGYSAADSYFNAGLLLLNVKFLREIDFTTKALMYIHNNSDKIILHDQDVLNGLLHSNVLFLSIKWNMLDCFYKTPPFIADKYKDDLNTYLNAPVVIHFSGPLKPWHHGCPHPLKEEYFKYSRLLAWGCKKKQYGYVFTAYKFPANILIWLGNKPEKALKISRKLGYKLD